MKKRYLYEEDILIRYRKNNKRISAALWNFKRDPFGWIAGRVFWFSLWALLVLCGLGSLYGLITGGF